MSEWEPIDTAPLGVPVLAWNPIAGFAIYTAGECDPFSCARWKPLPDPPTLRDGAIEELGLPARAYNALKATGIHTVAELRRESEGMLMRIPNLGHKSLHDVRLSLKAFTEGEGR